MAAKVDTSVCGGCETCVGACPVNAITMENGLAVISDECIECGACSFVCPAHRTITQFCRRAKNSIRARIAAEKAKAAAAAAKGK